MARFWNYLDPRYHLSRLKEDLLAFRNALMRRKDFHLSNDRVELAHAFRGRMFSAFFLSGPTAFLGAALGTALQYRFEHYWVGIVATIVLATAITTVAYQAVWWIDNRRIYEQVEATPGGRFRELQRDMWPIHFTGIRWGLTFALALTPLNGLVYLLIAAVNARAANLVPAPVVMFVFDVILVQGTFLRIMGDFFDRHSYRLADKYQRLAVEAA